MAIDFRASQIQTKQIIASGTLAGGSGAKLVVYPLAAAADSQGNITQTAFNTSSLNGRDIFLFVSGTVGGKNATGQGITVFGGDVHVSGTITSNTTPSRLEVGSYYLVTATSSAPQNVGACYYAPAEHPAGICYLRAIMATTTGSIPAVIKLLNVGSGAYVHIGGPGIDFISLTSTSASLVTSSNLVGATNFGSSGNRIYQAQVFGSGSATPIITHFNSELVFF